MRGAVEPDVRDTVLGAAVRAPGDLDPQGARELGVVGELSAGLEGGREGGAQALGRSDPEAAGVRGRAGRDVLNRLGAGIGELECRERVVERRQVRLAHPGEVEVLLDRHPRLASGILPRHVGEPAKPVGHDVAKPQAYVDTPQARQLVGDDRVPVPGFVAGRRGASGAPGRLCRHGRQVGLQILGREGDRPHPLPLEIEGLAEALPPHPLDQKLHPRLHARLAFAVAIEDPKDPRREVVHLLDREELGVDVRQHRRPAQAAAHVHQEPPAFGPLLLADPGHEADVVEPHGGMVLGAAFEGDLELPAHDLVVVVSDQVAKQGVRVGGDFEELGGRGARAVAGRDVAHGIAARLAGRNPGGGEEGQERRGLVELEIVDLGVLTRGEVDEA